MIIWWRLLSTVNKFVRCVNVFVGWEWLFDEDYFRLIFGIDIMHLLSGNDYLMKITFDESFVFYRLLIKWEWLFDEDYFRLNHKMPLCARYAVGMIIWWRLLSTKSPPVIYKLRAWEWLFDEDYFRPRFINFSIWSY